VLGVPPRSGGRRKGAGSAVAAKVAGTASGCASGGRRSRPLLKRPPRPSARVSAQPMLWKNLPVPGRAATSCSFPRGAVRISGSARACAVRLYGESSSARRGGGDGVNGGRGVAVGLKYVAAYCRPLPAGNQVEVVGAARRQHLTAAEVHGVMDLVVACPSRPQVEFVLEQPRRALRQAQMESLPSWDPRLSAAGNRVLRQLGGLLGGLGRMENWLRHRGRADLAQCDRGMLSPSFQRLVRDSRTVAELAEDQQQQHLRQLIEDRPLPPRPPGDYEQLYLYPQEPTSLASTRSSGLSRARRPASCIKWSTAAARNAPRPW